MKNIFHKTKEDISAWLDKNYVKNYKLVEDLTYGYVVDVNGEVILSNRDLTSIPVKFNYVRGNFVCSYNYLTSLEFCPHIVGSSFYCHYNELGSLEFCPKTIGGRFYCSNNPALKEVQNIQDFSQILAFHKETLIKIEKQNIDEQLEQAVNVKGDIDTLATKVLFKL